MKEGKKIISGVKHWWISRRGQWKNMEEVNWGSQESDVSCAVNNVDADGDYSNDVVLIFLEKIIDVTGIWASVLLRGET